MRKELHTSCMGKKKGIGRAAYISVFIRKSCVFPRMFHCPAKIKFNLHYTYLMNQNVLPQEEIIEKLTGLGHHFFTKLLFWSLWSPVPMAVMTD